MKNKFMFKSDWFDEGKIFKIKYKGLYLYCKLWQLVKLEGKTELNIKELQKCTGYTAVNTIVLLNSLKENGCITYYAPFLTYIYKKKFYDWEERFSLQFLDLPMTEKKHDESKGYVVDMPINEENSFVVVDMKIINQIMKEKLRKEHAITYVLLSKFMDGQCDIGFKGMSELLGITENDLRDRICIELELKGFICNYGNEENNFIVLRDINDYEKFKERHAEQNKKNKMKGWMEIE